MSTAYDNGTAPEILVRHRLRIAREAAGLEQTELAAAIGTTRTTISATESGRSNPRRILLNAWALATGVPITWILTGEEPEDRPGESSDLGLLVTKQLNRPRKSACTRFSSESTTTRFAP
jgi:transcriptional regulator with XRE-family HTH domain